MDAQKFYAELKREDRERVEAVVAALKSSGLQVYANSLWVNLIPDSEIALSVTPNNGMTRGDVQHSVDDVVRQFHGQIVREAVPDVLETHDYSHSPFGKRMSKLLRGLEVREAVPVEQIKLDYPKTSRATVNELCPPFTPAEQETLRKAFWADCVKPKHPYEVSDDKKEDLNPLLKVRDDENPIEKYKKLNEFNPIEDLSLSMRELPYDKYNLTFPGTNPADGKYVKRMPPENRDNLDVFRASILQTMKIIMEPVRSRNPTVAREQRYRIGTIGETLIEVRVSYKPIDALSKLLKVEL